MQTHELKPKTKRQSQKRVGRGGKRGTYSGRGQKGQKSRSGSGQSPDFRGGNAPLWKVFPKQRGATKKTEIKKRTFRFKQTEPKVINLNRISNIFKENDEISIKSLREKGVISAKIKAVKILNYGTLTKKLIFEGLAISKSAQAVIIKQGGTIK
ncbi:MAG: 50S ribosomal protein L15 [Candidatus Yanofskybacteria bacterium CG10_big_fil_rev_8_21_14_0_10_46_23]|uniref:Large ribosomal subunit protein uL15 n=1 Tax=Candidatus Yanofskybacteria bacterium CG10_big_fil_rev_8_21_14_0_10_46_23 TaxID=1975098 RepID=A0A2H0R4F7_9BACT|nr:MAG: 50S ribosomal protein L15 [Candidatus Yanofskybacteria bacterium CG10_big_fil_rev_8_21_14_0_10_46_23]